MALRSRISSLAPAERIALMLIRSAAAGKASEGDLPFVELAGVARRRDLAVLPSDATHVSPDEFKLLAGLAACQRSCDASVGRMSPELRSIVSACAAALAERATRLPYLAIQRIGFLESAERPGCRFQL